MFANRLGDLGSIPGRVIPKTQKWYLMPPCLTLSIIRYGSRVKWSNPGKGVAPSPTPWCSKLSKREPSGHPRLWSPTLLFYLLYIILFSFTQMIFPISWTKDQLLDLFQKRHGTKRCQKIRERLHTNSSIKWIWSSCPEINI